MKRFTETEKWRDVWFRRLTPAQKCLWLYLLDNCDPAGVIELDVELAAFQVGVERFTAEDLAALEKGVRTLPNGKLWVPRFIRFQFGQLSRACAPHGAVFAALAKAGIDLSEVEQTPRVDLGTPKGSQTLQEKDKEEEREKDKDNPPVSGSRRRPVQAELVTPFAVFEHYPNKLGQTAALRAIKLAFRRADPLTVLERTKAYAAEVAKWPAADRVFVPSGVKFYSEDRYLDPPETWTRRARGNTRIAAPTEADYARGF